MEQKPATGDDSPAQVEKRHHRTAKVFKARDSLADHLYESNTFARGAYHTFLMYALLGVTYAVLKDSYNAGRLYLDLQAFSVGFGSLEDTGRFIVLEVSLLSAAFLVHPFFKLWASLHSTLGRLADALFIALYLGYVLGTGYCMLWAVFSLSFPPIWRAVSAIEQARLCLKSYSFVRENAPKILHPWTKDDDSSSSGPAVWYAGQMDPKVGSFSQYLYFIFVPTLLYRDHYPRAARPISWKRVAFYFFMVLASTFMPALIFKEAMFPASLHRDDVVQCFLACLVLGIIQMTLAHIGLFHSWMNFHAELTRFADREFYSDWWNSENFAGFFRKWNIVVQDWIHAYVYQDFKTVLGRRWAHLPVFLMSSMIHDYQVAMGLGFFIPIFVVLFAGFGGVMYASHLFRSRSLDELFTVTGLSVGISIFMAFYLLELAARHHCPYEELTVTTFFTPRLLHCYAQFNL